MRSRCCARAATGHAAAPPSSVMNSRLFIDRFASDSPSRECVAEYRIGKDQFNVTDEGIIFLREVTPVSTWTEDDKRIATRALKTLEEASVASRGAAIYYLEPVRREMGIKRPDDIPERSDGLAGSVPPLRGAGETG